MALLNPPFSLNQDTYEYDADGLFNQQLDEGIQLFGAKVAWITQEQRVPDNIFGEHLGKILKNSVDCQLICDQFEEDFQNEDTALHSKFGFTLNFTEATFFGSNSYMLDVGVKPQLSDLIYYKKLNLIFEVMKITEQDNFRLRFDCELYNYDNIKIDDLTIDIPEINALDNTIENINDKEVTLIETPLKTQVTTEAIKSGRNNNLF